MNNTSSDSEIPSWTPDEYDLIPEAILVRKGENGEPTRIKLRGETLDIHLPIVNEVGSSRNGDKISIVRDQHGLRIAKELGGQP